MKWNDVFATSFEELKLTDNGEVIQKKRKLKYGGILVQYKDLETGKPKVAIYWMKNHAQGSWGIMPAGYFEPWGIDPKSYYEPWGSPMPASCEGSLVDRWNELNAKAKKAKGKKKCEADRKKRHGGQGNFQLYDGSHPYSW